VSGGDFDEVHDSFVHSSRCTTTQLKKTLSGVKETLTRASNTLNAPHDAPNFLSSALNYFERRTISPRVSCRCRKPL